MLFISLNLESKIASQWTSKMSLWIAIWGVQTMTNHSQVQKQRRGACFYRGKEEVRGCLEWKPTGEGESSGFWRLLLAELLLDRRTLSSSWGSKLLPVGKCKHAAVFLLRSAGGTSASAQERPLQGFLTPFEMRLLLFFFMSLCRSRFLAYMIFSGRSSDFSFPLMSLFLFPSTPSCL